jgi:glycosyltransferase involved in cell wall biosynthesis
MPDVSIITCVSRPDVYEKCLLASIAENRRSHDIEIIPVLNEDNRYSAANALNIGIDVARSDILVFAHQDIRLLYRWFDRLKDVVAELPQDWGVLGSAGISLDYGRQHIGRWGGALNTDTVAVGSVWDSDDKLGEPPYWDGQKDTTKVHCADECVLVLNKKTGLRFDSLFTGFHFYGVDLCLQARAAAYGVYCSHLPIIHYGSYSASFIGDKKYWVYLRLLYNKWRLRFPELLGTHMHWSQQNGQPEVTSYINVSLDSGDGLNVHLKSMGINKVKLKSDRRQGLLEIP